MTRRRRTPPNAASTLAVHPESLERRDCPAVVAISGPSEVNENGGPITLVATLSEAQRRPVEVRYFTSGTATAGQDYRLSIGTAGLQAPGGTFVFRPGQTSVSITLTPVNDTIREGSEILQFGLISARGHSLSKRTVAATIRDDDSYTATLAGPARVGAGSTSTFTLRLSSPATKTDTFLITTEDRSAVSHGDYTALTNLPLTFRAGDLQKTFKIVTAANSGFEADETFVVVARPRDVSIPPVAPLTVTIVGSGPTTPPPAGPPITAATFTRDYGWGVVNAAAAVGRMLGSTTALPDVTDLGGVNWGNDLVRAPEAWARGYTGTGIVVAVIDTGVDYAHPSLRNSIWVNPREVPGDRIDNDNNGFVDDVRGWDFYGNDNDPMDDIGYQNGAGGHGTHVAGTIAAAASAAGPRGVAFDAKIMAVRLSNQIRDDNYLASSILYAANNGAHVINLSLGVPPNLAVTDAIRFATSLGSIVVVASGNEGSSAPAFPAALATQPGVVAVGAVDRTRAVASFSNRAGSAPSLQYVTAPGVDVVSTVPQGFTDPSVPVSVTPNGTFATFRGTSMAAPHVAGVVALMLGTVTNPRAPGVRDRIVAALVGTSQQPPALMMAAAAAFETPNPRPAARAFASLRPV